MMTKNAFLLPLRAVSALVLLTAAPALLMPAPALAERPDRSERGVGSVRSGYQGRPAREVSDQEHAKERRDTGQNKRFEDLFSRARSVGRGEYLGVEPDISSNIYRFKFMRPTGQVVWVDMDGRTGQVLAKRD